MHASSVPCQLWSGAPHIQTDNFEVGGLVTDTWVVSEGGCASAVSGDLRSGAPHTHYLSIFDDAVWKTSAKFTTKTVFWHKMGRKVKLWTKLWLSNGADNEYVTTFVCLECRFISYRIENSFEPFDSKACVLPETVIYRDITRSLDLVL